MKKYFLLFGLVIFGLASANAQVELKALIGTNFSKLSGSHDGKTFSGRAGYQFGGGLLIGDKFYVEPGIQFGRSSRTITESSTSIDFDQNFVKIPVYAGYHLLGAESDVFALRVFAGPAVSIQGKVTKGSEQIGKDDIKKAIWAVDGGIGLDILFLFIEANYEHSFSNHFVNGESDSKHSAFIINAGVHFDF